MKPIELTLCGWGPYKNKQQPIDFTELKSRGLFLITGATGAGKTTIFDAVTYALYGDMSGKTREKNSVRSDFADSSTPTYVELLMEHEGKRYHIRRNPEYLRPKKRKTGLTDMTKEKENAVLTLPDGSHIEGSSEVTKKIQELLRLDLNQFRQLSMIAQGEFTRLLTAQSSEKSRIFRELFDTELYDRIAGIFKQRSAGLYKQVMEYRSRMEEDVEQFVPLENLKENWQALINKENYYYQEILDFLKENKKEYQSRQRQLEEKVSQADAEAEKLAMLVKEGEQTLSFLETLGREQENREKLKEREPFILQKEEKLARAEKALQVKDCEKTLENHIRQQEKLVRKLETVNAETESLKKKKEETSVFYQNADVLILAYEKEEKAEEIKTQLKQREEAFTKQQKELRGLQEQYLQTEAQEELLRDDYENAQKAYRHGIAGILARDLTAGIACPVCGSLDHPHKAVPENSVPAEAEVEKKKLLFEEKRNELTVIHGKTAACKERGEGLSKEIAQHQERLFAYEKEWEQQERFVREYVRANSKQVFMNEKKAYETLLVSLSEKEKSKAELEKEYREASENIEAARDSFDRCRVSGGFQTPEDYKAAFLAEEEMTELREQIQKYRQDCHACEHLIAHLEKELSGRKHRNMEELKEKLVKAKEQKKEAYEELDSLKQGITDMARLSESLKEKLERSGKLSEQYGLWKDLDDAANGNNRKRLVFEQYVLTAYFEEILKAANLRLKVMTGGRYMLRRMETVGDGRSKDNLEIEVLDYYTGKYRSVKTLSGGETFKVSLSLALGMSDMVQALSGGIRVDALFIDEGFGSLDSESLEQACEALNSLVEKDRLIGIISHVPELAEKIENQIRVRKTSAGSTIEVMV